MAMNSMDKPGPDEPDELPEMSYCDEHGAYPLGDCFCPGCEEVDRQIDDAIELKHQEDSHEQT
jgi:hypothetical protein